MKMRKTSEQFSYLGFLSLLILAHWETQEILLYMEKAQMKKNQELLFSNSM